MRIKHGLNRTVIYNPIYHCWAAIKQRCYCANNSEFKNYGGRGITLYEGWLNDPLKFAEYLRAHLGERPEGYSIDRIDNNGNYEPGNLRWASAAEQAHNTRYNRRLTAFGRCQTIGDWSLETGVCVQTIRGRLQRHLSPEEAVSAPPHAASGDNHAWKLHPELVLRGERHGATKLKDGQVDEIRKLLAAGITPRKICGQFGICPAHVSRIKHGYKWVEQREADAMRVLTEATQ